MPVAKAESATLTGLRTFVGIVLLSVGVIATIGTVLAFFGTIWWAFDVISGYRIQMAVLLVVSAVIYGLLFARITAIVFAVAAAVNIFLVVGLWLDSPPPAAGSAELTVVSYDTERSATGVAGVLNWLEGQDADIVFLFETNSEWIAALETAELPYEVFGAQTEERVYGITMLSRVEATPTALAAGSLAEPVMRVEIPLGTREVAIYATRARRATSEADAALRDETLSDVGRWIAEDGMPAVVIGPLNTSQWSYAFEDLKTTGELTDSMDGYGFQPTWQSGMWFGFRTPMDQALHTTHLTTTHRTLGPNLGSSHLPLMVTFANSAG